MTILGRRTEQLDIFCRITGFTSDFLSFIVVEHIRFFHGAYQIFVQQSNPNSVPTPNPTPHPDRNPTLQWGVNSKQ